MPEGNRQYGHCRGAKYVSELGTSILRPDVAIYGPAWGCGKYSPGRHLPRPDEVKTNISSVDNSPEAWADWRGNVREGSLVTPPWGTRQPLRTRNCTLVHRHWQLKERVKVQGGQGTACSVNRRQKVVGRQGEGGSHLPHNNLSKAHPAQTRDGLTHNGQLSAAHVPAAWCGCNQG